LAVLITLAFARGKVISPAEYKRTLDQHAREIAAEQRITQYHEKRAELEASRADTATAALVKLVAELPEALRFATTGSS
jgi:hypothetical protein